MLLIGLILGFFLLDTYIQEVPQIVTYQATSQEDQQPEERQIKTQIQRKPSSPSSAQAKVIAAAADSPTAVPVPDIEITEPSIDFGDDVDFGEGWSDGAAMGGGGGFGSTSSESGGLPGFLYDFKQDSRGNPMNFGNDDYGPAMVRIQRARFSGSEMSRIFRAPKPLYLTRVAIPQMKADLGPEKFGVQDVVEPRLWFAHYSGTVMAPRNGKFRFVGLADDYLKVMVDGKPVLHGSLTSLRGIVSDGWKVSNQPGSFQAPGQSGRTRTLVFGDWIDLRAGQKFRIDIGLGERPGGVMFASLFIEEEGVEYRKTKTGRPILPLFTTAFITPDEIEELQKTAFGKDGIEFDWEKTPIFKLVR